MPGGRGGLGRLDFALAPEAPDMKKNTTLTSMSTLMKVGAIDRAPGAQLIAPTFMSVDMVVIEIWLIKVVTPSQK